MKFSNLVKIIIKLFTYDDNSTHSNATEMFILQGDQGCKVLCLHILIDGLGKGSTHMVRLSFEFSMMMEVAAFDDHRDEQMHH